MSSRLHTPRVDGAARRSLGDAALTHAVNPFVRAVLRSPIHDLMSDRVVLLVITGRVTGRRRSVPASFLEDDDTLTLVSRTRRR
jgi:hypothetical protein